MKRLALVSLLALVACPRPALQFGPEGEVADAKQMLALLAKRDARFVTLRGDVKFHVDSPKGKGTVSQFLAVSRPAALHIETFNFFGKPVSVISSDGDHFSLYDAEKNVFYEGDATAAAMGRFLPVPIELAPEEIVALILGQVPRIPAQDGKLVFNADKRRYELSLEVGSIHQLLYIEPKKLDITRSIVTGADAYNLTLDDFHDEPGGSFPHSIELEAPATNTELSYKYVDVKVNDAPDLSLFRQDPPASAKRVTLDAAGNPVAPPP